MFSLNLEVMEKSGSNTVTWSQVETLDKTELISNYEKL